MSEGFLMDDAAVTEYLKRKLPDWHMRLRAVEQEQKDFHEAVDRLVEKMEDVHKSILGSTDGNTRGILRRLEIVESWKSIVSKIGAILFTALITAVAGLALLRK